MPYIPNTPESLLARTDSKNPADTCRGLTNNGRPCRRGISKSPASSLGSGPLRGASSEAYCWQHKAQAADEHSTATSPGIATNTIRERTSTDTLADRLGLLEVGERPNDRRKSRRSNPTSRPPQEESQPRRRKDDNNHRPAPRPAPRSDRRWPQQKQQSGFTALCCFGSSDNSGRQAPRLVPHHRRPSSTPVPSRARVPQQIPPQQPQMAERRAQNLRPPLARDPSSKTAEYLALIPTSVTPQISALLLSELAKPVSAYDDPGYIYMFWLTPDFLPSTPFPEMAPSLLAPQRPAPGQRRTSAVLKSYTAATAAASLNPEAAAARTTIMLKIGRAANVQRRLNQWTQQCGYNLSLIRYYPYNPSSQVEGALEAIPRRIPYAHKIERLIHIELSGLRAKDGGRCTACGKEHREWFEVDASRKGIERVDEAVRRWVDWGLSMP